MAHGATIRSEFGSIAVRPSVVSGRSKTAMTTLLAAQQTMQSLLEERSNQSVVEIL